MFLLQERAERVLRENLECKMQFFFGVLSSSNKGSKTCDLLSAFKIVSFSGSSLLTISVPATKKCPEAELHLY